MEPLSVLHITVMQSFICNRTRNVGVMEGFVVIAPSNDTDARTVGHWGFEKKTSAYLECISFCT